MSVKKFFDLPNKLLPNMYGNYQSKSAYILSIPFDITLFYMETGNTHDA